MMWSSQDFLFLLRRVGVQVSGIGKLSNLTVGEVSHIAVSKAISSHSPPDKCALCLLPTVVFLVFDSVSDHSVGDVLSEWRGSGPWC